MALKESEAIVLRTYPLRESDLLVTLFTRLEGKVKGVARAAKKSKRRLSRSPMCGRFTTTASGRSWRGSIRAK
jgi:DNA repair protein RecO